MVTALVSLECSVRPLGLSDFLPSGSGISLDDWDGRREEQPDNRIVNVTLPLRQ